MSNEFETDFELYKIFYIVAETKSITATAKRLFITQPSVTKRIQNLESRMGCALFARTKQGVRLTAEGKVLYDMIAPACRTMFAAEKAVAALNSLESGEVSIVSTEMSFKSYVLPAMERFTAKYPGVKIKFANALNERMDEMLRSGKVDLAIMHEPFRLSDGLQSHTIESMNEYMVCGKRFHELAEHTVSQTELTEYPLVSMPEGSSSYEYLRSYFSRKDLDFEPDIELTTVELMVSAVEGNLGISILPERIAKPLIESGKILQITLADALPQRRACIITNKRVPMSTAARAFAMEIIDNN